MDEIQPDQPVETPDVQFEVVTPEVQSEPQSMEDAIRASFDRERDELGRFKPKEEAKPEEPVAEVKPEQKPEAKPEAKPEEPKPDDVPAGLSEQSQTRFRDLATRAKEAETKLAEYEPTIQMVQELNQRVESSGLNQDEFWQAVQFGSAIKRGDWQSLEPILAAQFANFRMAMGRDPQGADPLAAHPDIVQEVQAGRMSHQFAIELARSRSQTAIQRQQFQVQQQEQQRETVYRQTAEQSVSKIDQMVKRWEATDLDWPRKKDVLNEKAKQIVENLPPEQWVFAINQAYDVLGKAMTMYKPPPTPTPLRASGAPAASKAPGSMEEAIRAALGGE